MQPAGLQRPSNRGPFLGMMLSILALAFFVVFLVLISGGFFMYVVAAVGALVLLCGFHYVLWGRALTHAVAGEREEELLRQRAQDETWDPLNGSSPPHGIRRP
jgi:hypothetical protein